jgi:hypothetical protein
MGLAPWPREVSIDHQDRSWVEPPALACVGLDPDRVQLHSEPLRQDASNRLVMPVAADAGLWKLGQTGST